MMHQPNLSPKPGKDQYVLLDDYPAKYGNIKIVVPAGLIYDGASIPRFGWQATYTPFHPDVMGPALVHDWLYLNYQLSRDMADQIFYDLLVLNGASKFKAEIMYQAVRFGGAFCWGRGKSEIQKIVELYDFCRLSPAFDDYHFPMDVIWDQKKKSKSAA